jgi:hypothetical protein
MFVTQEESLPIRVMNHSLQWQRGHEHDEYRISCGPNATRSER